MERRHALKIIGAIGVSCAFPFGADELYGQEMEHMHHMAHAAPVPTGPYTPKFFSASEMKTLAKLSDLIIPPTDTPGGAGAGVPQYIDLIVSENQEHQSHYREGLAWLDQWSVERHGKAFRDLSEEQQIEILTPLSDACDRGEVTSTTGKFFRDLKSMTADGYYTSQIGLVQELGYKGNTALDHFPTFTLPEH